MTAQLSVQQLESVRNERVLYSQLNFSLSSGEILLITGNNGAGKTTLLKTIAGLLTPNSGDIFWNEQLINENYLSYCSALFYLGHKNTIKTGLTAEEQIKFSAGLRGQILSSQQIESTFATFEMSHYQKSPVSFLSAGQKQKLALMQLLFTPAKLWILDEPFVAIDKTGIKLLENILLEHVNKNGMVLLTSHQENLSQHCYRSLALC